MKTFSRYSSDELYKIALYGVKNSGIKIDNRDFKKLNSFNKWAQSEINILKQERVIELSNQVFKQFHHSGLAKELCDYNHTYRGFFCKMTLRDLGITKEVIIKHLKIA